MPSPQHRPSRDLRSAHKANGSPACTLNPRPQRISMPSPLREPTVVNAVTSPIVRPARPSSQQGGGKVVQAALRQIALLRAKAESKAEDRELRDEEDTRRRTRELRRCGLAYQHPRGHSSDDDGSSSQDSQRRERTSAVRRSTGGREVGVPLRVALGINAGAPSLRDRCALVLIDCQNTYTEGPMRLHKVEAAIAQCKLLLKAARRANATVVHIMHHAGAGTLYDVGGRSGAIVEELRPLSGEKCIVKSVPSSFHDTDLQEHLEAHGVKNLILCGFMTHCCVSSTARAAFNLQMFDNVTVVAAATATRSLPTADGSAVDPDAMQRATLAGIAELHANVVPDASYVPA